MVARNSQWCLPINCAQFTSLQADSYTVRLDSMREANKIKAPMQTSTLHCYQQGRMQSKLVLHGHASTQKCSVVFPCQSRCVHGRVGRLHFDFALVCTGKAAVPSCLAQKCHRPTYCQMHVSLPVFLADRNRIPSKGLPEDHQLFGPHVTLVNHMGPEACLCTFPSHEQCGGRSLA